MADGFQIDTGELSKLAADIAKAPASAANNIRKAIEVTSRYVRDDWRKALSGSTSVPRGEYSISYDIEGGRGIRAEYIESQIGPDLDRSQGSIVGLVEEGTPTLAPRGYGLAALERNQADLERGLQIAIGDVL